MKAEDARKKAHEVNTDSKDSQLAKIRSMIITECEKGKYEMWYYETLLPDVKNILHKDGFAFGEPQFDRNETMVKISW